MAETLRAMVEYGDDFASHVPAALETATRQANDEQGFGNPRFPRCRVPMSWLTRDLNVGTATAGGNLVGSPRLPAAASLVPFSLAGVAGMSVIQAPGGSNPAGLPVVSVPPVAGWVNGEGGTLPESDAVFSLEGMSPGTVGCWMRASRKFMQLGGEQADFAIRSEMVQARDAALDVAVFAGTGANGQPRGIVGHDGVATFSGAALSWYTVLDMRRAALQGGAGDDGVAFVASPMVRLALSQRERAAGSGFIWDNDKIDGRPAYGTRFFPANTLICGDFRQVALVLHGDPVLIVDRHGSTNGSVRFILMQDADVRVIHPGAFAVATSVT